MKTSKAFKLLENMQMNIWHSSYILDLNAPWGWGMRWGDVAWRKAIIADFPLNLPARRMLVCPSPRRWRLVVIEERFAFSIGYEWSRGDVDELWLHMTGLPDPKWAPFGAICSRSTFLKRTSMRLDRHYPMRVLGWQIRLWLVERWNRTKHRELRHLRCMCRAVR